MTKCLSFKIYMYDCKNVVVFLIQCITFPKYLLRLENVAIYALNSTFHKYIGSLHGANILDCIGPTSCQYGHLLREDCLTRGWSVTQPSPFSIRVVKHNQ
jgi:hypothetical protein